MCAGELILSLCCSNWSLTFNSFVANRMTLGSVAAGRIHVALRKSTLIPPFLTSTPRLHKHCARVVWLLIELSKNPASLTIGFWSTFLQTWFVAASPGRCASFWVGQCFGGSVTKVGKILFPMIRRREFWQGFETWGLILHVILSRRCICWSTDTMQRL